MSEADVKAAERFLDALYDLAAPEGLNNEDVPPIIARIALALASARAEGEAAGKLDHHRNWPDCPSCVKWANDDMSASEAYSKGEAAGFEAGQALMHAHCLADEINQHRQEWEAAGAAKEREAVVRWLWEQWNQHEHSHPAVCIERGDHLRALTPEGKR